MVQITSMNLSHVETLAERVEFTRKWLELSLGRTFDKVKDSASTFESDSNGKGYSYLLQLGSGNASTRFQVWITARGNAERVDMYIGKDYSTTDTIDVASLATYRKGNDRGQGNTYRDVPLYMVKEFFDSNELTLTHKRTTEKAKRVTA
jgi:hypothetical protein